MFTGLIQATGTVLSLEERSGARRIHISAPTLAPKLNTGDSIAVSGVCLTALDIDATTFRADLAAETVARTTLAHLHPRATVNLELPTPAGAPLGGHIVQGHVDGVGILRDLNPVDPDIDPNRTDWWLKVEVPENVRPFMVDKGSIAVEGISLTLARCHGHVATIAILPHTWSATNLHTLNTGSPVNIEADVLMKLALKQQQESSFELTLDYLVANGF